MGLPPLYEPTIASTLSPRGGLMGWNAMVVGGGGLGGWITPNLARNFEKVDSGLSAPPAWVCLRWLLSTSWKTLAFGGSVRGVPRAPTDEEWCEEGLWRVSDTSSSSGIPESGCMSVCVSLAVAGVAL